MEGLISLIEEIRADREAERYDEASTKQSIILPVLDELGWRPRKRDEVYPEYSVGKGRVDYALRLHGENKIFIEVKKVSENLDTERFQEQLLTYSFRLGVKLSILTNGLSWWFYLPLNEGNWEQRKFYSINVREQELNAICNRFIDFLSKSNVETGKAVENAEQVYKSQRRDKAIKEAIPKAWNKLLDEEDELLLELISETTEKICGYKPGNDVILKFVRENKARITFEGPVHKLPPPKREERKPSPLGKRNEYRRIGNKVEIVLNSPHTPITYSLIPISTNIRDFFPGYKVPFILETDVDEKEVQVTSGSKGPEIGDPEAGKYIQGKLKDWYEKHSGIKEGSIITIVSISHGRHYRLSIRE